MYEKKKKKKIYVVRLHRKKFPPSTTILNTEVTEVVTE